MAAFEIQTGCGEKLKVERRKYRGNVIVSVRKFYLNASEKRWFPTTAGVSLTLKRWREILPELVRLLDTEEGEAGVTWPQSPVLIRSKQEGESSKENK